MLGGVPDLVGRWREHGEVEVQPDASVGGLAADLVGDRASEVAALGAPSPVAEPVHQRDPGIGDPGESPAGFRRPVGEPESRQRRHHEMEGVPRVTAVGRGIGQWADDLVEIEDGAGPSVGHDQREGVRLGRAHMEEVNAQTIDDGA